MKTNNEKYIECDGCGARYPQGTDSCGTEDCENSAHQIKAYWKNENENGRYQIN